MTTRMSAPEARQAIAIDLPWPDKILSPNARPHWASKAKATKKHRDWARWAALPYGPLKGVQSVDLRIIFYPPDRRRRDDDSVVAMCKAYRDGVADILQVDDNCFVMQAPVRANVEKHGRIRLELEVRRG